MSDNLLVSTPPRSTFSPKQIACFYFKSCLDEEGEATGYYMCKTCRKCHKHTPKTGYTSLVPHVRTAHPNYVSDMLDASVAASGTLLPWLDELLASLCDVESVSKRLQADGLTMLDARDLCDGLVEIQPSFSKCQVSLTDKETDILEPFKRCTVSNTEVQATRKEGFADRILKRRKVSAEPASYALLGAIPPTSNIVERLFSVARSVLRHERHRLSPMMLEMIFS
ncbi:hypothetical protein AM587_10010855 [Phytophthora nicotianae]|uniref:BED-type domain-containing protein n=1 Tax=Phytophthora nicotianae TaxID=4792 RepID=A0A0W8C5K0_PHYNI|nr:hypothetical protein AM587_10010855 [Phytophthora nicotianae]